MNDVSFPPLVTRPDLHSVIALMHERAATAPDHCAFTIPEDNDREVTLPEFLTLVDRVAAGLVYHGFQPGDRACILGATSFAWSVAEYGIWRAGGVVIPIYDTSSPSQATDILNRSGARILFTDNDAHASLLEDELGTWSLDLDTPQVFGADVDDQMRAELDHRLSQVHRRDLASLVYTSGTTGQPKGARITHANFIDLVLNVQAAWSDVLNEEGRTIIFLPLAHVLARGLQMICMWAGMRITHMSDPKQLIGALPDLKPTFLVVVPRILEKILEGARKKASAKKLGAVFARAQEIAVRYGEALETADHDLLKITDVASFRLRSEHAFFDKLFFSRVRSLLGGSIEFLLSGAARLDPRLSLMFRGMGIPVMEGYGLTETTAPMSGNRPGRIRSGTVGEPVPGTHVRVRDGRILVRGIGVADGYDDPNDTAEAFVDGFFDTGDLGFIDADGYLTITGRVKDIVVTAGGKNISPAKWESSLESDPLVAHAVVVGENQPYLSALILLDRAELPAWAEEHGHTFTELQSSPTVEILNPAIVEHMEKLVASANANVARSETIKYIRTLLVDEETEKLIITPTLKKKRADVVARFDSFVQDIYSKAKK